MRRFLALIAVPMLVALALAGCGSSKPSSSSTTSGANTSVTATGALGKAPKVVIPKAKAASALTVKTVVQGTGPDLTSSEAFVGNFVAYIWSGTTNKLAGSTFTSSPQLFGSPLPLAGLTKALVGKPIGSRVLVVIPPKDGYGVKGQPSIGVTGTDTLVFVVDMIQALPSNASATGAQVSTGGSGLPTVSAVTGKAPTVTIPASSVKPPTSLITRVLVKGKGPALATGQLAVVQYTGVNWRTGKVFDSSWQRNTPFGFTMNAPQQVIPGWDLGLSGQTVGSRVMLVIPPKDGYGASGVSQAGINGTDDLVFVIDILGGYSQAK